MICEQLATHIHTKYTEVYIKLYSKSSGSALFKTSLV